MNSDFSPNSDPNASMVQNDSGPKTKSIGLKNLIMILDSLEPLDEDFPEISDPPIEPEDIF